MNSTQIRWVLDASSTLPPVSTDGISVIEWRLPGLFRWDVTVQDGKLVPIPEALRAVDTTSSYGPARPYAHTVDGMAIYKGVQL